MEVLLNRLENQIKELIDQHRELKQSNQQLHHGKSRLALERDILVSKQQDTIEQIKGLISKLKTIETVS